MPAKPTWKELLARSEPLILPCAHDALSARLIEPEGFAAYSVGGYALVGARHALPDIGLVAFGEMSAGIRDIMAASSLPVLVDCDDGYGDAKNVARTIAGYEGMGVSAIFMEDQRAPKRCGHMAGKDVIDADAMATKLRAAVAARRGADLFIIARTDARAVHGLDEALRRGKIYLKAGADGRFIEAPQSIDELPRIGRTFTGVPPPGHMWEGGGGVVGGGFGGGGVRPGGGRGGKAGIVGGAAPRRGQAGAVLPAADGDGAARLLPRRRARGGDFRLPRRRPCAAGLDRRQRRRGHRRLRSHHPDAGEEPADRCRGAARGGPRLCSCGGHRRNRGLTP